MKKRLIMSILAVSVLLSLAIPAFATETAEATEETTEATEETREEKKKYSTKKNGECGDDLTWALDGATLTITGSGEMDDGCPWEFYKDTIETVIFNGDITTVGAGAFESCNNLENIYFGDALVEIGEKAFYSCNALETILLPDTFRKFGPECFRDCENLEEVFCEGPMPSFKASCFYNNHTVVVYFSHQTPWPWEEIDRLMSNFGGRIYAQVGSEDEWEDVREKIDGIRAGMPAVQTVVEETVPETTAETVAATQPVPSVPVMTQPAVTETVPAQIVETTAAAEPVVQEESQSLELVFVEPEQDLDTGETQPKTLKENIEDRVAGFNWGWVIAGFGGLVILLVLALVIRGLSHKGGKYSD